MLGPLAVDPGVIRSVRALVHRRRGTPASPPQGIETLGYGRLDGVRNAVVAKMRSMTLAGAGTEARRSALMQITP